MNVFDNVNYGLLMFAWYNSYYTFKSQSMNELINSNNIIENQQLHSFSSLYY